MRMRIRSPTYGWEKKKTTSPEDFTSKDYERRSQNRSKTGRQKKGLFFFWVLSDNRKATKNSKSAILVSRWTMDFFNSAVEVLQTLVIALGAGLGIWGAINLLEGYGNDNRATRS